MDKEQNNRVDSLLTKYGKGGYTRYEILGMIAQQESLSLDASDGDTTNIQLAAKLYANSKKRLKRSGVEVSTCPAMLKYARNKQQANADFIELCENIYFHIEHHIEAYVERNYDKSLMQKEAIKDLRYRLKAALGFDNTLPQEKVFEANSEYIEKNK